MQLIFASANQNKIREIKSVLPPNYSVIGLSDINITDEIPEPGQTIKENSFLKAQFVVDFLKDRSTAVFADDSGLEVEALNNAPGVHSARFAGIPKSDTANNSKLLSDLKLVTNR